MAAWNPRVVLIGGATAAVLSWTCPRPDHVVDRGDDPQQWIRQDGLNVVTGQLAGLVGWLALAWLAAGVVLVTASRLPGAAGRVADRLAGRVLPVALRRVLTVTLGLGVAASGTGVAGASSGPAAAGNPRSPAPLASAALSPWPPEETSALWTPPTHRPLSRSAATGRRPEPLPRALDATLGTVTARTVRPDEPSPPAIRAASATQSASRSRADGVAPAARPARDAAKAVGRIQTRSILPTTRAAPDDTGALHPVRTRTIVPIARAAPEDADAVDWPLADEVRPVTVGPGDSLWLIAARRLDPDATVSDVAEAWPEWYAANRSTVGPDPDLLRVGHRLVPP